MLRDSDARFEAFDVLLGPMTKAAGRLWMNYRRDVPEILGFLELLELSIAPRQSSALWGHRAQRWLLSLPTAQRRQYKRNQH